MIFLSRLGENERWVFLIAKLWIDGSLHEAEMPMMIYCIYNCLRTVCSYEYSKSHCFQKCCFIFSICSKLFNPKRKILHACTTPKKSNIHGSHRCEIHPVNTFLHSQALPISAHGCPNWVQAHKTMKKTPSLPPGGLAGQCVSCC